jgi:NADPH:quinone reductase-like Zn-dependent oxidoreductase
MAHWYVFISLQSKGTVDAHATGVAYQALKLVTNIQPKVHVLIHAGASGVGLAAIQLARLFGAATVTATASTTSKLAFLTGSDSSSASLPPHGRATQGVNYKTEDFSKKVEEHTGGHGVDVVVDFVGASHWEKNIASLASDGRMVLLAFMGGAVVPNVNLYDFLRKRISVQGSSLRARSVAYQADLIARFVKDVSEKLTGGDGDGDVRTYIHKVYKWEQIKEAHQEMEGNDTIGKIIMEIS